MLAEVRTILTDWFHTPAAAALFNHHFDGVNIDRTLATGVGAGWLAPHATGYAGATGPDGATTVGLLTRTSRPDTVGAEYMLSPFAIPAQANAGFVIATPRFLESMIAPALMHTFGIDPTQLANTFSIVDNRIFSLTSLTYPLKGSDGKVYNATIDPKNFSMQVDGGELVLNIVNMTFDVGIPQDAARDDSDQHGRATAAGAGRSGFGSEPSRPVALAGWRPVDPTARGRDAVGAGWCSCSSISWSRS